MSIFGIWDHEYMIKVNVFSLVAMVNNVIWVPLIRLVHECNPKSDPIKPSFEIPLSESSGPERELLLCCAVSTHFCRIITINWAVVLGLWHNGRQKENI